MPKDQHVLISMALKMACLSVLPGTLVTGANYRPCWISFRVRFVQATVRVPNTQVQKPEWELLEVLSMN